ncbi:MAG: ester cyclase [Vicinamibacterales bacterium]
MTIARFSLDQQVAALNRHDVDTFLSFYAPEAMITDPQYPEALQGIAAIRKDMEDFLRALPDLKFTVDTRVDDGQTVAFEGTCRGTHNGPMATPQGEIPATGRPVTMRFAAFVRLSPDGRIAQERRYYDVAGVIQQLGLTT